MKCLIRIVGVSLLWLPVIGNAQDMSGWSDKTVCRLVEQQGKAEYVEEMQSRGLDCKIKTVSAKKASNKWDAPNELDELTIPENWQPFSNLVIFEDERARAVKYINGAGFKGRFGRDLVTYCPVVVTEWRKAMKYEFSVLNDIDISSSIGDDAITDKHRKVTAAKCMSQLVMNTFREGETPDYIEEALLYWANNNEMKMPRSNGFEDYSYYHYQYVSAIAFAASHYAAYIEDYNYTDEEHDLVRNYLAKKLLSLNSRNYKGVKSCDPLSQKRTIAMLKRGDGTADTCGSLVWKALVAQLVFGLRFNNEEIFKQGILNTKWQLHFFDEKGTFITWAMKGPNTFHYSSGLPTFLGVLTEIFHTLEYDFIQHKLPSGLVVKQVMDRQIEILEKPQTLWEYAKLTKSYRGVDSEVYRTMSDDAIRQESNVTYESVVRNMARYIDEYRQDLHRYRSYGFNYRPRMKARFVMDNSVASFNPVDSYSMYRSNSSRTDICSNIGFSKCRD